MTMWFVTLGPRVIPDDARRIIEAKRSGQTEQHFLDSIWRERAMEHGYPDTRARKKTAGWPIGQAKPQDATNIRRLPGAAKRAQGR